MKNITPYQDSRSIQYPGYFQSYRGATIEAIIGAWIQAKTEGKSNSPKTEKAYRDTIKAFREMLLFPYGLDLIWYDGQEDGSKKPLPDFLATIADYAQVFASMRSEKSRRNTPVRPATVNQRLAILSSFYAYAIKRGHIKVGNPIDSVDRPKTQAYANARAIDQTEVEARLKSIDPKTLQGARDLALLALLLSTGRRVSEIATLTRGNIEVAGKMIRLNFEHTKGGDTMQDLLSSAVSKTLTNWLEMFYNVPVQQIPADKPLWVNVHHKSRLGQELGYHGVAGICEHYLGTSKVHVTRHTFAVLMENVGAKLTDIQKRLGHKNAATTGVYLEKLTQDKNPYADKIAQSLGLED